MQRIKTTAGYLYVGSKDDAINLINKLTTQVFDIIWNLAYELDFLLRAERDCAKEVLWGEIEDYNVPDNGELFTQQLNYVVNCLKKDGRVFIHCFGGHGRTGMVLAVIKKTLDNLPAEEALQLAKTHCNGPETEEQQEFVRKYNG